MGVSGFGERPKRPNRAKGQVARKRKGLRSPRINGTAGPKGILADDFDDSSDFAFAKVSVDAFNQCRGITMSGGSVDDEDFGDVGHFATFFAL